jgi:ribosomal protein S18 acetylase RimI-like enzyme
MMPNMTITQLKKADKMALTDINVLLVQLRSNPRKETLNGLNKTVTDTHVITVVAKDNARIVGMGFLFILQTLQKRSGYIEDVVVHEGYRGQGLGVGVMKALIAAGKKKGVDEIELTSRPARVAANALYQKLGFTQRDTNVYQLKL